METRISSAVLISHKACKQTLTFVVFAGIRSLVSDLYSVMEYILQMAESLTTGPRHDSTNTHSVNSCHMHRIDPSKIADVTKMVLRQLAIGIDMMILYNNNNNFV